MPEILDTCIQHLIDKGYPEDRAYPICKTSLGMSKHEDEVIPMAEKLAREDKEKTYQLQTFDVPNVEIFATGEWNGDKFSQDDLNSIVGTFQKLKDKLKPYLKLGHGEDQKLLESDELPAAGWVENLRIIGNKLVADFKRVPAKIKELIDSGGYRKVSIELFQNFEVDNETFPLALKSVALLGAEIPAVNTLDDIIALYGSIEKVKAYQAEVKTKVYTMEILTPQTKDDIRRKVMDEQITELSAKLADREKQFAELTAVKESGVTHIKELTDKVTELSGVIEAKTKEVEELSSKCRKFELEKKTIEVATKVDELIRSAKLAPAQKEFATALLGSMPEEKKFSIGDKEYKSAEDLLFAMLNAGEGVKLNTDENTQAGQANRNSGTEIGLDLDRRAKEYAEKNKTSYREALLIVSKEA